MVQTLQQMAQSVAGTRSERGSSMGRVKRTQEERTLEWWRKNGVQRVAERESAVAKESGADAGGRGPWDRPRRAPGGAGGPPGRDDGARGGGDGRPEHWCHRIGTDRRVGKLNDDNYGVPGSPHRGRPRPHGACCDEHFRWCDQRGRPREGTARGGARCSPRREDAQPVGQLEPRRRSGRRRARRRSC